MDQADTLRKIMEDRRTEQERIGRQSSDGRFYRARIFQTTRDQNGNSVKLESTGPIYRLLMRLAALILGWNEVNR